MKAKLTVIPFLLAGSLWLAGCEQEGPAERTGKKADESMERAGEQMERGGERVQERARGD